MPNEVPDARIAIVRDWFAKVRAYGENGNLPPSLAETLLAKLESTPNPPSGEVIERVDAACVRRIEAIRQERLKSLGEDDVGNGLKWAIEIIETTVATRVRQDASAIYPPDALALARELRAFADLCPYADPSDIAKTRDKASALVRLLESAGGGK